MIASTKDEVTQCLDIKRQLRRTWPVFFARFGKLLPIQLMAIPVVLEGRNAIIVSATASGKTEAVLAPLCERMLSSQRKGLSILYITPTRALANDLADRFQEILRELHISFDIKTGDHPTFSTKNPPDILVTTPESFDSMLCRYAEAFSFLTAVIIDEIHNTDMMYRGDQVRLLLKRLREHVPQFSVFALSATVNDPGEVASRYMDDPTVIETKGRKEIHDSYAGSLHEIHKIGREERLDKMLIFCNSRRKTEAVAYQAKSIWGSDKVFAHHGSLSKHEREETELAMRTLTRAVCVSTMTLELGIDIGDIDAVVLADLPWSVSSMIQRMGRGCRRTSTTKVIGICSGDDRPLFEEMMVAAKDYLLETHPYRPDLSVVVQQILSLLYANPAGINKEKLLSYFTDFADVGEIEDAIIPRLIDRGFIERRSNKFYASEKLMNMGEHGYIHSNIPDTKAMTVVNADTSKVIGDIVLPTNEVAKHATFVLAGKVWQIAKVDGPKLLVKPSKMEASPATFMLRYEFGKYFWLLPEDIQKRERDLRREL